MQIFERMGKNIDSKMEIELGSFGTIRFKGCGTQGLGDRVESRLVGLMFRVRKGRA